MTKPTHPQTWRAKKAQLRETRSPEENAAADARSNLAILVIAARKLRGLSQTQLAELVGTRQPKISEYENGEGNPTWETLSRIFGVLGLSLSLSPSEMNPVAIPRAEYEALLRDREDLGKLREGIQGALLSRTANQTPLGVVTFSDRGSIISMGTSQLPA